MNFETYMSKWVILDNRQKQLQKELQQLKNEKQEISEYVLNHVVNNDMTNTTVSLKDGRIRFNSVNTTQPLTFKYLESCLGNIIKNPEQIKIILGHIKSSRDAKTSLEIHRYYNK